MGASESLAKDFQIVKDFNDFVIYTNSLDSTYLSNCNELFADLKLQSESFFAIYKELIVANKIPNLDFQKIKFSLDVFQNFITFLKSKAKKNDKPYFLESFKNDFQKFIKLIIFIIKIEDQILKQLSTCEESDKNNILSQFYLEFSIFCFSFNIKKIDKQPYYIMTYLPAYSLRNQIHNVESRYVNITAPHASGKTLLVPLHIGSRILNKQKDTKCIILIEHERSTIQNAKNVYKRIVSFANSMKIRSIESYGDNENKNDDEILTITSSFNEAKDIVESNNSNRCICILSPLEALSLLRSVNSMINVVKKTIFIVDDIHLRTVQTDVLLQELYRSCPKSKVSLDDIRIALVSTVVDINISNNYGWRTELKIKTSNMNNVQIENIRCRTIKEIENKGLISTMVKFFNEWTEDEKKVDIGSSIVFVPSEKVGQRVYKKIFSYYSKDNSMFIYPIRLTIRKGEKMDDFYSQILQEMNNAEEERILMNMEDEERSEKKIIFLLPIILNERIVTNEERNLIQNKLPPQLISKNLVRVVITTIKNESLLQMNDLKVIFDTGIEEVEFFDPKQFSYHIREQLLPQNFIEEHQKLLGANGKGIFFSFNAMEEKRPIKLIPYIRRGDLGRELLALRKLDIRLENQSNLPNEPNHEILDECIAMMKRIGIMDNTKDNNLTTIGLLAAKFSSVSPFFALATAKFNENQQFAFLCSLLIENSRTLVLNPNSEILMKNFNRESDIVTLLDSFYEISKNEKIEELDFEKSGFSSSAVYSIYSMIENVFNGVNGRISVVNAVNWARNQPNGTLGMVDKFVSLLDENEFLSKRRASFRFIVSAGLGCEPVLVYNANNAFQFNLNDGENHDVNIKFARRPGSNGLQSPGSVIALSVISDDYQRLNRGLIVHHDSCSSGNLGVVSFDVDNPSFNSPFFIALFNAYMNNQTLHNDFIRIYHTSSADNRLSSLIHVSEYGYKTFLSYCPKNKNILNTMKEAMPTLSSLMPFVSRSIIVKLDQPQSAVEIIGYGASNNRLSRIHLFTDDEREISIPYPVNRETIDFCASHIDILKKTNPSIRFALTGECFYYKLDHGRQCESNLMFPDVDPAFNSVFDAKYASHLFILVDKSCEFIPNTKPLPWVPKGDEASPPTNSSDSTEENNNELIISVASKIMNGMGYAMNSADFFFVMINNSFPTPEEGEVPESIRNIVEYSEEEGKAIKGGIHSLIRHFLNTFSKKQKLQKAISLKKLGSTESWSESPKNEENRNNLCEQINQALFTHFKLKDGNEVQSLFIGSSIIAIRIVGLDSNFSIHENKSDLFDNSYKQCKADIEIMNVIKNITTVRIPVTQVVHVPTISIRVWNMRRFGLKDESFIENVNEVADNFGFLVSAKSSYKNIPNDFEEEMQGVIGDIEIEFLGMSTGIAFATSIKKHFKQKFQPNDITLTNTITSTCLGMEVLNPDLPPAPRINQLSRIYKIEPSEIETLQQIVASKPRQKQKKIDVNSDYNVLICPMTEDGEIKKMLQQIRDPENNTTCVFMCNTSKINFLPQSLYVFQEDGKVKPMAICKQCIIEMFRRNDEFQSVLDPVTQVIDQKKLTKLNKKLSGISFVDDNENKDGIYWPQIPFGQSMLTLVSDTDTIAPYIKSWFTIEIDFIVRKSSIFFTRCPNHPEVTFITPHNGKCERCKDCDMFFCGNCKFWHNMSEKCTVNPNDGIKRCPYCNLPVKKKSGCNHIECVCGKHWCYKCDVSLVYDISNDVYTHMSQVHGGYYG